MYMYIYIYIYIYIHIYVWAFCTGPDPGQGQITAMWSFMVLGTLLERLLESTAKMYTYAPII